MTEPDVVVTAWLAGLAAALRGEADIAARARRWQVVTDGVEDEAALAAVHGHVARLAAAEPDLPATPLAVRSCRAVTEARPVDD